MSAQVIKLGDGYFFLKIDNLFTTNELREVWEEINFLSYRSKFQLDTGTARHGETNELKADKIGIWLEDIYTDRKYCNYFKFYKKWCTKVTAENLLKTSLFWRELFHCKTDRTLLSYYEDGKYYEEHEDASRLTQLFYVFKEPKKFTGGQIVFTDFNYSQEVNNNTLIVFPSWFKHEVKPVSLNEKTPDEQDKLECNGRYVFTTFYE